MRKGNTIRLPPHVHTLIIAAVIRIRRMVNDIMKQPPFLLLWRLTVEGWREGWGGDGMYRERGWDEWGGRGLPEGRVR